MPLKNNYIKIKLANAEERDSIPTIRPGTVLYGEVECKPASAQRLSALTVCLVGKLVVRGLKGRREVTQVFGVQHPILKNDEEPVLLDARINRFPFHFVVPWTTEYDRTGTFQDDHKGLFTSTHHRVPPSLEPKWKGDAQICYSCYAVGRNKGVGRMNDFATFMDFPRGEEIENIRCIVELPPVEQTSSVSIQRDLSPPTQKSSSGFFRRGSTVSGDSASTLGLYKLSVTCLPNVVLGQTSSLNVIVERVGQVSDQTEHRCWTVAMKSIDLVTRTYRRFKDVEEPFLELQESSVLTVQKPISLEDGIASQIEISITDLEMVPSFRSYTISRLHALRIGLLSSVSNEVGKVTLQDTVPIEVPVEIVRQGDALLRRSSTRNAQDIDGQEILPPAYEESPTYRV